MPNTQIIFTTYDQPSRISMKNSPLAKSTYSSGIQLVLHLHINS